MLQFLISAGSPTHRFPPFRSGTLIVLVLPCIPPPQLLVHKSHWVQGLHSQSTVSRYREMAIRKIKILKRVKNHKTNMINSQFINLFTGASMQIAIPEFGWLSNAIHSSVKSRLLQNSGSVLSSSIAWLVAFSPFSVWSPFAISCQKRN